MGELQSSLGASGKDGDQLRALNKAYAQFKTVESAASKTSAQGGVFTPTQAINAAKLKGNLARVGRGKGLLQAESELARDVLGKPYPDSGTAGRLNFTRPGALLGGAALALPASLLYSNAGSKAAGALGRGVEKAQGTKLGKLTGRNSLGISSGAARGLLAPSSQEE